MRLRPEELKTRAKTLWENFSSCTLCPRNCRVNRVRGQLGFCRAGEDLEVAHVGLHFGEEPFLSGTNGSGTIFFAHCNLRCLYCQNWQISQPTDPNLFQKWKTTPKQLAQKMIALQNQGAHNINLVSPAHYLPQILESLYFARKLGLKLPIVYNTNAYENLEVLKIPDGIVDIYLPDIKYADDKNALKYSAVKNYVKINRAAIQEMFRQVGLLKLDKKRIAIRGLIVRHLVLPNNLAGTKNCLEFLSHLCPQIQLSLMSQYTPCHKAHLVPELNRKITVREYQEAVSYARNLGFKNILTQEIESSGIFLPNFDQKKPFKKW